MGTSYFVWPLDEAAVAKEPGGGVCLGVYGWWLDGFLIIQGRYQASESGDSTEYSRQTWRSKKNF